MHATPARARLGLIVTAVIVMSSSLALPAPAFASEGTGPGAKWPQPKIRIFNAATADARAFNLAVAAWNGASSRVRFVKVPTARQAQVVVRYHSSVAVCGFGYGSIGYPGFGQRAEVRIKRGPAAYGQSCSWPGQAIVITHELGHVLGFRHDATQCSIMNPTITEGRGPRLCVPEATGPDDAYVTRDYVGRWRCGTPEKVDVQRLVRRYGGTSTPRRSDMWCDVYEPIAAPGSVTATRLDVDNGDGTFTPAVRVEFTRPADPVVPEFISLDSRLSQQGMRNQFLLYRTAGACPTSRPVDPVGPPDGTVLIPSGSWTAGVGEREVVIDAGAVVAGTAPPLGGPMCWTAVAWDSWSRPARVLAQASLTM